MLESKWNSFHKVFLNMIYSFQMMYSQKKRLLYSLPTAPNAYQHTAFLNGRAGHKQGSCLRVQRICFFFSVTSHFGNNTTLLCDHLNKHNCFRKHCLYNFVQF